MSVDIEAIARDLKSAKEGRPLDVADLVVIIRTAMDTQRELDAKIAENCETGVGAAFRIRVEK